MKGEVEGLDHKNDWDGVEVVKKDDVLKLFEN